jgi:hypothetical protein
VGPEAVLAAVLPPSLWGRGGRSGRGGGSVGGGVEDLLGPRVREAMVWGSSGASQGSYLSELLLAEAAEAEEEEQEEEEEEEGTSPSAERLQKQQQQQQVLLFDFASLPAPLQSAARNVSGTMVRSLRPPPLLAPPSERRSPSLGGPSADLR